MKRTKTFITLLICLVLLGGCSSMSSGSKDGDGMDGSLSEQDLNAQREARYGSGSIPMAEGGGLFRDVYFGYNSSELKGEALQNIEYNVQLLKENPNLKIQLEGHCDERGTVEYNLALGSDRARSVQEVLQSFGISRDRIDTISYGEEVPLDPGHNELAWSKNRRVHFSAYK